QTSAVKVTQLPTPGATTSVNTINPTVQVQGPFSGSVQGPANVLSSGRLSLREAVERGVQYNLGAIGQTQAEREDRGLRRSALSVLLPNLNGYTAETVQQTNLQALGLGRGFIFPGVSVPAIVGPFNFFDLRATLSQSLIDRTAFNNYRSSVET